MVVGDMEIRLRAEIARLQQDMERARQTVGGAMGRIGVSVGDAMKMLAGFAAALSVGAFVNFIKGAIDAVDALNDMSARTKVGIEDLAGLAYGAKLSDTSLEGVASSITKLAQNIGKDGAKFRELGITATEPLEAFKQLADVFKGIQDPQQRAAFGAEVLGKSWQEAAVLLDSGSEGIAEFIVQGKDLSGITEQIAGDAGAFNDKLDELGFAAQGAGTRIAAGLLPTLNQIVEAMSSSAVKGDALKGVVAALSGTLKILYTVGVGVVEVFATMGRAIGAAAAMTVQVLSGDFAAAWQTYKDVGSDIAEGWGDAARRVAIAWSSTTKDVAKDAAETGEGVADTGRKVAAFLNSGNISSARKKATDEAIAFYSKTRGASINHLMQLEAERDGQTALSAEEKKRIEILNDLLKFGENLTGQQRADIEGWAEAIPVLAAYNKELQKSKAFLEKREDEAYGDVASAMEQTQGLKDQIMYYGLAEEAVLKLKAAEIQRGLDGGFIDDIERERLQGLLDATNEQISLQEKLSSLKSDSSITQAKELLDILVAVDNAAQSAAQGMAASFGSVGAAIGGLTTALTDYAVQQQAVAAQLATVKADPKSSAEKIAQAEMAASKASAQAQIKSYGDMASASKGFFKENSKGYKALEATERAFRAFEMAMAIESMVRKVFAIGAVTTATVAGEGVKTSAVAAGTAAQVAADTVKGTSAAAVAVATQAQGDPYSAWARMAAMVAAMAALGFAVAGGGGSDKSLSQQRQETQGTGSVFGDSTAKSDSIKRSLELVAGNSNIELSYTQGMLAALRNIESSLGGLGNVLVRNSGLTSSTAAGTGSSAREAFMFMQPFWSIGANSVGNLVGKIFGGKTTVEDTGFKIDPTTLGAGMAGNLNSFQYTDIKKSGGWFSSDDWDTKWNALGGAADAQFAAVLKGLGGSVAEAAKLLGVGGDAFTQRLNGFVIDIGKISLKGMSSEEIQKTLESVFSKLGDDLASYAVAGLDVFAQIGEGPLETLTRIAANYANLDSILASSSTSFGQVGMSSIAARERLIALAGGIDELADAQTNFNENFLSEAERLAAVQKYVTDQLAALGLQGIDTRDKFKEVVLGLSNSGALATEAGAAQYTALLALADAFAKTHAATEDLTKSEQEIADERKDLAQQLAEITKSEAELLAIQRAGIADVNKALFDQVQAAKAVVSAKDALASAYDREASAAKTALDRSKAWVTTLNGLNANLMLGNQSTLTPEQKYAEARAQFEKTLAAANAGDTTAQSGLSAAEQAFLTASQVVNASDAKYAADYARVIAANQEAAKWASQQVDLQQASYDALEAQVKSLITINDSVLTVAQAIANLQTAMGVTDSMGVRFTNAPAVTAMAVAAAPAIDFSRYQAGSNAGSEAMAAEIKALREEVKGLRADNAAQTGAVVRATTESNAKAASTVVSGVEKSAQASAWNSTVKGEYA